MSKREEDGKASGGDRRLIGLLGLAMRAGALAFGTEQVCGEIRRHGFQADEEDPSSFTASAPGIVMIASDASENTRKRVENACRFYHLEFVRTSFTSREIGDGIGKPPTAVYAVFDRGFERGIREKLGIERDRSKKVRKDAKQYD